MKRLSVLRTTTLLSILLFFNTVLPMSNAQVNATTWQYNNWRTGQDTSETTLTTTNVTENTFGRICSASVDGQIYAQPLVLWNSSTNKNVVYVVTQNDTIYAFDGTNCSLIASNTTLIPSTEAPADCNQIGGGLCQTIAPTVGILGTPVIDTPSNTIYLITESQYPRTAPTTWYHRIHALDAATLNQKTLYNSPQIVAGSVSTGLTFVSLTHIQRPGLLLTQGPTPAGPALYATFSMMDGATSRPSGWIFGYDGYNLAATGYPQVYASAPGQNAVGSGIWQGGAGLAAGLDENGGYYLYFSTADGTFDLSNGGQDAGDSFVKVTTTLNETPAGYFAPSDQVWRSCLNNDMDFGSGGTMLIPDGTMAAYPNLSVKADKEGALWVMKRGSPGGFSPGSCDQTPCPNTQACSPANQNNQNVQTVWTSDQHVFRSTPAFWNNRLYIAAGHDPIVMYPLSPACNGNGQPIICPGPYTSTSVTFTYDATPSISSNGTQNGIVWAISHIGQAQDSTPGILYAFDALTLTELYDSNQCFINHVQVDQPGPSTKFSVPTIANGYVYIGTQTNFDIYGPKSTRTCSGN